MSKGGDVAQVEIEVSESTNTTEGDMARSVESSSRSAGDIALGVVMLACVSGCLLLRLAESYRPLHIAGTWPSQPEGRRNLKHPLKIIIF
mmetsp:Transcript_20709/g.32604  ORF Transcript_20709/g.32604 Transcript_20709/m.32604 type:complete len:90 (+) Transcript_20709:314-583(+)